MISDLPERLVVISPHLDDAVLSCGSVIASRPGAHVLTVFAGRREDWSTVSDWDSLCGFGPGEDAIGTRREEDKRALTVLHAAPHWLDHLDVAYRGDAEVDVEAIAADISAHLERLCPEAVLVPLGLHHGDHLIAHAAAIRAGAGEAELIFYGDFYHLIHPEEIGPRIEQLEKVGMTLCAVPTAEASRRLKRRAVGSYRTQRRGLGRHLNRLVTRSPELLWKAN